MAEEKVTGLFGSIFKKQIEEREEICKLLKRLTPAQTNEVLCLMNHISQAGIGQDIGGKLRVGIKECGLSGPIRGEIIEEIEKRISPDEIKKMGLTISPLGLKCSLTDDVKLKCDIGEHTKKWIERIRKGEKSPFRPIED